MYCLNCGKKIPDSSKFCLYCGTNIEKFKNDSDNDKTILLDKESVNKIISDEISKAKSSEKSKEMSNDKKNEDTLDHKHGFIENIFKSKKFKIILSLSVLVIILFVSVIVLNVKSNKNINADSIIGCWTSDNGNKLTVTSDSYSFIEDQSNPDENYEQGRYEIFSGTEGLEKAGYSKDKISKITSEYNENQIVTLYTTTEKQKISGINISKIKNKNDYYIIILKNKDTVSGIRILDEKTFHLKKEQNENSDNKSV